MKLPRIRPRWLGLALLAAGAVVAASLAFADAAQREGYLRDIDSRLASAASELSGVKSDSDDSDIRDADSYIDQVRDLVSRLDGVKGDDSKAREIVDRYPGYVEKYKRASAALRSMKGYQHGNVTLMKTCQDKNTELVNQARDFEHRNDPEGLEKLPRIASDLKNLTVRFLEEAERFRAQMEDWKRTVQYFDVSDGKWNDVRTVLAREADEIYSYYRSDLDTARQRCKDLAAGPDHPVVREVLAKLASSSAGRKEVMENLTRLINELAAKIKDVPGASGVYAVDNARERLDAIDSTLQILERTKGSDPRARELAERWPAIAREARASIAPLKELKEHHRVLDELPGKCKEMESRLDSFIAANGDDSDGIDKIPAFAAELGNPVIVGMAKAKERLGKMSEARSGVRSFSRSDGPWSNVKSAYEAAADDIYRYFEAKHEETLASCQNLMRAAEHPRVKSALDRLRASSGSAIDVLTRDVNAWVTQARATYRLDCDSMQQLWEAYCSLDWEPDDPAEAHVAEQVAASLQTKMQSAMSPQLASAKDLAARAAALSRKRDTKDRANSLLRDIEKENERLGRLVNGTTWRGTNDPLKFYAAEYGKSAHRRMASDFRCSVSDKTFPGSRKRPDCVRAQGCTILEFKSQHPRAKEEGEAQLVDYKKLVTDYYQAKLDRGEDPDSELGGKEIMRLFADNGCIKDKRFEIKNTKVESYAMCERRWMCVEP